MFITNFMSMAATVAGYMMSTILRTLLLIKCDVCTLWFVKLYLFRSTCLC